MSSVRQRKDAKPASSPADDAKPATAPVDNFVDAPPQLCGSMYDTENPDVPPLVATPRPTPTALESEVCSFNIYWFCCEGF